MARTIMKPSLAKKNPRRVSKRRAASYAGIDPRTLDDLIDKGLVRVYRAAEKCFRVDLDELDAAMLAYGSEATG
jgi:hypothetical protein